MNTKVFDNPDELISAASGYFFELANERLKFQPTVRVLLTGGTLGIKFVEAISRLELPWERFWFMFSDERFVGFDHPDRNEQQALAVWPEMADHLQRYPSADIELGQAANALCANMTEEFGEIELDEALFDLCVLGMGPDGHVASLFPGHTHAKKWIVSETNSPKPPSQRLSFSYEALARSERVIFLASGASKAQAVSQALAQGDLPAAKVKGKSETTWYLDRELSDAL